MGAQVARWAHWSDARRERLRSDVLTCLSGPPPRSWPWRIDTIAAHLCDERAWWWPFLWDGNAPYTAGPLVECLAELEREGRVRVHGWDFALVVEVAS
jgi:hypothetical protein